MLDEGVQTTAAKMAVRQMKTVQGETLVAISLFPWVPWAIAAALLSVEVYSLADLAA